MTMIYLHEIDRCCDWRGTLKIFLKRRGHAETDVVVGEILTDTLPECLANSPCWCQSAAWRVLSVIHNKKATESHQIYIIAIRIIQGTCMGCVSECAQTAAT